MRIIVEGSDSYSRTVGRVMLRSLNLNAELVRRGAAWVYPQYNRDPALPAGEQVPPWGLAPERPQRAG